MKLRETLDRQPKAFVFLIVIVGLALVAVVDYGTGDEISFSIFYLIPISVCLWYIGKWEAITVAILSAVLWFLGENRKAYTHEEVAYWNALVRMGFFIIVVLLLDYAKKFNLSLENIIKKRTSELRDEIVVRKKAEEEIKIKNEQLSQLAMKVEQVKEEQNLKVAREVHDELGQMLTAVKVEVSLLANKLPNDKPINEKVTSVNNLIDETINSVRKISTSLRPRLLDDLGLFPAIEMQVREFQTRTGIRCITKLPDREVIEDKEMSVAIFRIFQEAMTNIARHANATHVQIKSYVDLGKFYMEIKDNGVGLNGKTPESTTLGILGMKERANLLNGEVVVENKPGGGTFIKLKIPLNNSN
ncbi:MAG: sensor histidine kinase [Ignavibacteriae bacterium]|nr:sensor histidine kinase [Ignavibacteriota bacterium]